MFLAAIFASAISLSIPERPIAHGAIEVCAKKRIDELTLEELSSSFEEIQTITSFWESEEGITQHLAYGVWDMDGEEKGGGFTFQLVPFVDAANFFTRLYRQCKVLWGVTFPGSPLSEKAHAEQAQKYQALLEKKDQLPKEVVAKTQTLFPIAEDQKVSVFCDPAVLEKQRVFEGEKVNILYNYAPIGLGGEKLHFLITPKRCAIRAQDLTKDEYAEAFCSATLLVETLAKTRNIAKVHFLHKTGKDAGQTVPHWHLHVIIEQNALQGTLGRLTILKNMALGGGSKMSDEELRGAIKKYKKEFSQKNSA